MRQTTNTIRKFIMTLIVLVMTAAAAWADSKPVMNIEVCEGHTGYIYVKGWAYDPDNQDCTIYVILNIYPDRTFTESLYSYTIIANKERTDVAELQNIQGNHGFEAYIPIDAGDYWLWFSAYNKYATYGIKLGSYAVTVTSIQTGTVTLTPETGIVTLPDGAILTGTGGANTRVSIARGATVTLSGMNITAIPDDNNHEWAGITCLGDATIILAEGTNNLVKGGEKGYPGIQVGPPGKTLTIRGSGSLTAQGNGYHFAAGIGSALYDSIHDFDCGNIVIEGGNITAYGETAPAIGASHGSSCGNITIKGGTVYAEGVNNPAIGCVQSECAGIIITGGTVTAKSEYSPAIGSNIKGVCGNITITGGTVTAESRTAAYSIGIGTEDSSCGTITIGDVVVEGVTAKKFVYNSETTTNHVSFKKNVDGATGMMADEVFFSTAAQQPLTACTFSLMGYTFTGWNTKADGSGTNYTDRQTITVTSDMTLYAQWHITNYTVSFKANGGTGTMADQEFHWNKNEALSANTFTRTGYEFTGWNTKADGSGVAYADGQTIRNLEDMTLYAQWCIIYTVSFNANGGTGTMADQEFHWNKNEALSANIFTRTYYDFVKWNTKADGSGTSYTDGQTITVTSDMTLYAQWTPHNYSITYNLDGGTNASNNPATYTFFSDNITLAEPTRLGYTFDGWTYEGQTVPTKDVTIAHGSHDDKTFTAHWTLGTVELTPDVGYYKLVNGHTLTGTGGANTHIIIADGATVTLSGVTITDIPNDGNHMWAGISCEGNATIILAEGTTITVKGGYGNFSGITVPVGKTLTIRGSGTLIAGSKGDGAGIGAGYSACGHIVIEGGTIIATGGDGAAGIGSGKYLSCGNITITDGVTSVTATAGAGAPYSIGSGSNSTVGTVTIGGVVTGSILQSPFTYNPLDTGGSYTVTFDANGGEGSMDEQYFSWSTPQALTANTFTRTDYIFERWNTKADGTGLSFSDGQTIAYRSNMTLYAQWMPGVITKTIDRETGEIELVNGDGVTGTGGFYTHVTIADGATVTLYNLNITGIGKTRTNNWAGITCLGDATIILGGNNDLEGGYESAGIFVPEGKTLTIQGDGSLTATGHSSAAGIGANNQSNCGNIVISGGRISVYYGYPAAAIGCGCGKSDKPSTCGDITITSGVIIVTAHGEIGRSSGTYSTCGTISIDPSLIDVTVTGYLIRTIAAPATASTITTQPENLTLKVGSDSGNQLSVEATAAEGHTLSYQWYTNTTKSTENGTPIDWAVGAFYTVPTDKAVGTTEYYYCVVTATRHDNDQTTTVTSDVATVTFTWPDITGSGTEQNPYVIYTANGLNLVAQRIYNGSETYASAWYELGRDIEYSYSGYADDHNYVQSIGRINEDEDIYYPFTGHFDGKGHSVSGIRIYRKGTTGVNSYRGLFGWIGQGGTVTGITLRDARITGHTAVGGIVGLNSGTVSDCYVGSDVVIHALAEDAVYHGGIAGYNMGTVTGCVSAATVSIDDGSTFGYTNGPAGCLYYGGIVGYNYEGTLSGNLALGATVSAAANDTYGAIAGYNGGTLSQNFYSGCTVAGVADAGDVGLGNHRDEATGSYIISDVDGAWKLAQGDVNRDRQVTVTDAAIVTGYVKTHTAPEGFVEAIADMDGDSQATEADVVEILKKILE